MNKRKIIYLILILTIILTAIIYFIMYVNNREQRKIEKFLEEYYTVEEIAESKIPTMELVEQEKKKYINLLSEDYLEKWLYNRMLTRNIVFSYENQCTMKVSDINIIDRGAKGNGYSDYDFTVKLELTFIDSTRKTIIQTGKIQMKQMDGGPRITYLMTPVLKAK